MQKRIAEVFSLEMTCPFVFFLIDEGVSSKDLRLSPNIVELIVKIKNVYIVFILWAYCPQLDEKINTALVPVLN